MRPKPKHLALFIYCMAYALIYAGWISHRSFNPVVFSYSARYFIFLVIAAIPFFLPFVIWFFAGKIGWKKISYSLMPLAAFLFVLYLVSALIYYNTQEHPFDPFLQTPVKDFEAGRRPGRGSGSFRILCLGGSTTACLGLPAEKSYPGVLEKILKEQYPHGDIEVFNGGVNWYTTKHSLISYVTDYSGLEPDLVIVMHAINDIARSFSPRDFALGRYNDRWTHFYGASINGARPPTFEKHLLSRFETPINAWYGGLRFREANYPKEAYVSLSAFRRNLEKLIRYAKVNRGEVILVSQPSIYKTVMKPEELERLYFGRTIANKAVNFIQTEYPSPESFRAAMELFNKSGREIAGSQNIIHVDGDIAVAKNLENFYDDVHYTARGAELLARLLAEEIVRKGYVESVIGRIKP